jgi:hypothetical protein
VPGKGGKSGVIRKGMVHNQKRAVWDKLKRDLAFDGGSNLLCE